MLIMAEHYSNCHKILKIYKRLNNNGFSVEKIKKGTKIKHLESNKFYIFHYSAKGYHPLRRWCIKEFGFSI